MVSFILVTHNRASLLGDIINKIIGYNWDFDDFLIVNNCSSDDTLNVLDSALAFSRIKFITTPANIGHGAALAAAFDHLSNSPSKYFIVLEDDSYPSKNLPNQLIGSMLKSDFDIISTTGFIVRIGKRIQVNPGYNSIISADFCLLDGAILNAEMIRAIGFPERDWFMMFDDFEYCYRIKKKGFRIGVIKNDYHQVLHAGGGERFSRSTLWRSYYQSRNHVLFLRKHLTFFNFFDFCILQIKRIFGSLLAPDRFERIYFRLKGIFDGLLNRRGITLDPTTLKFSSSKV